MKYVIVEDSRLARLELKALLKAFPELKGVGEAGDGTTAIELIGQLKPDLIFLDIQLPGKNGFEVLDALEYMPKVIFTTAFDEFAIRSFEYNTIDYLVKPIQPKHLKRALEKIQQVFAEPEKKILQPDQRVFVKDGEKGWLVKVKDIRLFESFGNYTRVYFQNHGPLILKTLNYLESILDPEHFLRINRSQIINLKHIESIRMKSNGLLEITLANESQVTVSRRQSKRIRELFGL